MNSEKEKQHKNGKIKTRNIFKRLIEWIAEGASKPEKRAGQCST